ncbi:hypothetical protein ACFVJM_38155 [Streptomyces virginiae]|uniref:hypothetical protein n=1 Tax=Streptomyces virginiae TaxID=1961 RepID=UPI0036266987
MPDPENRRPLPETPGSPSPELQARAETGLERFLDRWEETPDTDQHDHAPDGGEGP